MIKRPGNDHSTRAVHLEREKPRSHGSGHSREPDELRTVEIHRIASDSTAAKLPTDPPGASRAMAFSLRRVKEEPSLEIDRLSSARVLHRMRVDWDYPVVLSTNTDVQSGGECGRRLAIPAR